jgi:hypothetical protein
MWVLRQRIVKDRVIFYFCLSSLYFGAYALILLRDVQVSASLVLL